MTVDMCCHAKEDFLSYTVAGNVLTIDAEQEILETVKNDCKKTGLKKALINQPVLEKRTGLSFQYLELFAGFPEIKVAVVCPPGMIDQKARLNSSFSYSDDYRLSYFSEQEEAIDWLVSTSDH